MPIMNSVHLISVQSWKYLLHTTLSHPYYQLRTKHTRMEYDPHRAISKKRSNHKSVRRIRKLMSRLETNLQITMHPFVI